MLIGSPLVAQKSSSSEPFPTRKGTPRLSLGHIVSLGSAVSDRTYLFLCLQKHDRDKKTLDTADFIFSCQGGNMGEKDSLGFARQAQRAALQAVQ